MKIVACFKRVPTTEALVRPSADGKSLDPSGLQYMVSFYDELAVEEAVKTKEQHGGEVTVVTIGPADSTKEVREFIAKGADHGAILKHDGFGDLDCRATAKTLAEFVKAKEAELVFVGRVATDRDNSAVGPMLATYLGWSCVTEISELTIDGQSGTAKRETETGVETVKFNLPAVLTCNKGLNEPRRAGLKDLMKAKKVAVEELEPAPIESDSVVVSIVLPPPRAEGRIVGEGPDAVPALMTALQNEAKVL